MLAFLDYHAPVDGDPLVLSLIMHVGEIYFIHYAHRGWGGGRIISFDRRITAWLAPASTQKASVGMY